MAKKKIFKISSTNSSLHPLFTELCNIGHFVKRWVPMIQVWNSPSLGYVKVNEDVVVNKVKQRMGIGTVVKSISGT